MQVLISKSLYEINANDNYPKIKVGLHELLGHGCGKLLQETEPGKYNFDVNNPPISPVTGQRISTWQANMSNMPH